MSLFKPRGEEKYSKHLITDAQTDQYWEVTETLNIAWMQLSAYTMFCLSSELFLAFKFLRWDENQNNIES